MTEEPKKLPLLYNCYYDRSRTGEQFVAEHAFTFQVAGILQAEDSNGAYETPAGAFRFVRRNQLVRFVKVPPPGGAFQSLSVQLSQDALRRISAEWDMRPSARPPVTGSIIPLPAHPLYRSFAESLWVYVDLPRETAGPLLELKVRELLRLLLQVNPELGAVLFDFSEPGKIDLEAFMRRNFRFNVPLERFAYLSGRSLSTFKRDFEKVFGQAPSRWLLQQRLEEAHFLIGARGHTPSDVYLDVGFENFSHFSHAYKKQFGVPPSGMTRT